MDVRTDRQTSDRQTDRQTDRQAGGRLRVPASLKHRAVTFVDGDVCCARKQRRARQSWRRPARRWPRSCPSIAPSRWS
jgi:hypothetical protein